MKRMLVTGETGVLCIIGYPIGHSRNILKTHLYGPTKTV